MWRALPHELFSVVSEHVDRLGRCRQTPDPKPPCWRRQTPLQVDSLAEATKLVGPAVPEEKVSLELNWVGSEVCLLRAPIRQLGPDQPPLDQNRLPSDLLGSIRLKCLLLSV